MINYRKIFLCDFGGVLIVKCGDHSVQNQSSKEKYKTGICVTRLQMKYFDSFV